MRKIYLMLLAASIPLFSAGCEGAPQEADISHLTSEEAKEAGAREAEKYKKTGRYGPSGPPARGQKK